MKPARSNRPSLDTIYHGTVIIPFVRGISNKFTRIGNPNVRTVFKTKHTLHSTLMKSGLVRDAQQRKQRVYSIPCVCGKCYIFETSRPLDVRINEHKYNLTQGLLEKSKLSQHACEEGHKICLKVAKVLQIEPNITYRKIMNGHRCKASCVEFFQCLS
jgi:hypothetical protein